MPRWVVAAALTLAVSCSETDHRVVAPRPTETIVVASFDFAESRLLAEIYAQALEDEGLDVSRQLGLGSRELMSPALRQGFVDVVPEYAGSALDAAAPDATTDRSDAAAVVAALAMAVEPWGLTVLAPAGASNQNAVAVTAQLAVRHGLTSVSDLRPLAPSLVFGGPAECAQREHCLLGLDERYGLRFESFVPLANQELVRGALEDGVIDAGLMFTTDVALAGDDVVLLVDDRHLQPVEPIVPVVRREAVDERTVAVLDEVSAELTTPALVLLNWRIANAGAGIATEARGWLLRHGLIER